tara:strand:- start:2265 stop:2738 length:474 start_codon:yes stop_codon:yes gene_type:complete
MNSKDLKLLKSKLDIKSLIKKIDAEVKNINTRSDLGERTLSYLVQDCLNADEEEFQDYEKLLEETRELEDEGTLLSKISDNFKIVHTFSESILPTVFTFTVIESKINNRLYLIVNDNDGVNPKVGIGLSSDSSSEILDELNKTVTKLIPDRSSSGRH